MGQHYTQHRYNVSSAVRNFWGYNKHTLENEFWHSNLDFNHTELEHGEGNAERDDCCMDPDFTYTCDYITLTQCQALMKDKAGDAQVVSFSPGVKCSNKRCDESCGCFFQSRHWRYGERFTQGCEECICTHRGRVDCVCKHLTQRKEIRDLTVRERMLYQRAIRKLYARPGKTVTPTVFVPCYLFKI